MKIQTITKQQAAALVLDGVKRQYTSWLAAGCGEPTLVDDFAGTGAPAIAWEDGPYEWAINAFGEYVDEETYALARDAGASRDRARQTATVKWDVDLPANVDVEPYDAYTLCVYVED